MGHAGKRGWASWLLFAPFFGRNRCRNLLSCARSKTSSDPFFRSDLPDHWCHLPGSWQTALTTWWTLLGWYLWCEQHRFEWRWWKSPFTSWRAFLQFRKIWENEPRLSILILCQSKNRLANLREWSGHIWIWQGLVLTSLGSACAPSELYQPTFPVNPAWLCRQPSSHVHGQVIKRTTDLAECTSCSHDGVVPHLCVCVCMCVLTLGLDLRWGGLVSRRGTDQMFIFNIWLVPKNTGQVGAQSGDVWFQKCLWQAEKQSQFNMRPVTNFATKPTPTPVPKIVELEVWSPTNLPNNQKSGASEFYLPFFVRNLHLLSWISFLWSEWLVCVWVPTGNRCDERTDVCMGGQTDISHPRLRNKCALRKTQWRGSASQWDPWLFMR